MPKINKKYALIFGTLVIISLVYLFVNTRQKPAVPITTLPPVQSALPSQDAVNLAQQNLEFTPSQYPELPRNLAVYGLASPQLSLGQLAQALADKFNLNRDPSQNSRWLSADKSTMVFISEKKINLHVDAYQHPDRFIGPDLPVVESSVQKIQGLFTDIADWKTLELDPASLTYLKSEVGEANVSTQDDYNLLQFSLNETVNAIPLKFENDFASAIEVTSGQNNEPVKLTVSQLPLASPSPKGEFSSLTLPEFTQLVKDHQFTPIHYVLAAPSTQTYPQFGKIQVTSIQLEYRALSHLGLILPYLNISGSSKTGDNVAAEVMVIIPALSPAQLEKILSQP